MNKTALVTGAAGFVGQSLVLRLLQDGYKVNMLDLPDNPEFNVFLDSLTVEQKNNTQPWFADITDYPSVLQAMQGVAYVFHTAALLNSVASPTLFEAVNVQGTRNVCKAASSVNAERFVLVSTSDVFGIPKESEVITEETDYRTWGEPYADTKIKACKIVQDYYEKGLLNTTIIYPGWVYGPGDRQFLPAIMDMVNDKHAFIWHRNHPYCVDLIFIDDLVTAILSASQNDTAVGQGYLILDDNSGVTPERFFRFVAAQLRVNLKIHKVPYWLMYSIAWISQKLRQKGIVQNHLLSTTDVKAFGNNFLFSNKKARDALNWKPSMTSQEGLKIAFDWQQQR